MFSEIYKKSENSTPTNFKDKLKDKIIDFSLEDFENEVEKTEKDIKVIDRWISEIQGYVKKLDIERKINIEIYSQVHFIDDKEFFNDGDNIGFFENSIENLFVDASLEDYEKYTTLLHEMIHLSAWRSVVVEDDDREEPEIVKSRSGYVLEKECSDPKMDSFNEAVTELITDDIIKNNIDFLENLSVKIKKEKLEDNSYFNEIDILNIMIKNVSDYLNIDDKLFITQIKKGYFDGSKMHLRMFEKVYGKGFLKIIANPEYLFNNLGIPYNDLKKIFNEIDSTKRDEIIKNILSDEKHQIYLERLQNI